ncbi:MAG: hypothetical protein IPN90_13945 [Elusimicrobia bacterium]|nr:hypothetical protein [Elusimicrobiota bacterium]
MNDDLPIQQLFQPFREIKAPEGFADKVMANILSEAPPVQRSSRSWGRWVWTGGLALAASLFLMVSFLKAPPPVSKMDLSLYLADTNTVEEEIDLGTEIESYFL